MFNVENGQKHVEGELLTCIRFRASDSRKPLPENSNARYATSLQGEVGREGNEVPAVSTFHKTLFQTINIGALISFSLFQPLRALLSALL